MKKTTLLVLLPAAAITTMTFSSCSLFDPDYKAWKAQQTASAATNPVAGANPYGVPQPAGEAGTYTPSAPTAGGVAPYQPLPGVTPSHTSPAPADSYIPSAPTATGANHTVVAGDSLWGLAKKYGTSVESIQSANNLTNTVIRKGQTLIIPSN